MEPEHAEAHNMLGVINFFEGVHAMNFIDRQQCLQGGAAQEQRELANEKFRQAREHFIKSIAGATKDDPAPSETLNYLANIALHFEDYKNGVSYSTQAIDNILYAARHMALGTRGWIHYKAGNDKLAARDLRQALFHQPKFCVARYRLAKVYYRQNNFSAAQKELDKVVDDKNCQFQDPSLLLGLTYTKLRQPQAAAEQFQRCITLNPNSCMSTECRRYTRLIGQ